MNIVEACNAILEGKKVRMKRWWKGAFIYKMVDIIIDENGREFTEEWELYKESPKLRTFEERLEKLERFVGIIGKGVDEKHTRELEQLLVEIDLEQ